MYIESITNEVLLEKFKIIELKVRGEKEQLEKFSNAVQDHFDLAHDDWDDSLRMLTLTFDNQPKEQTLNMIKSFTKDYIANLS